ncbi:MAG: hypothetical protein ABIK28_00445 [Planctomycetota bacterium]
MRRRPFSEFLYRVFRQDIGRKAMALGLACIVWLLVDQKVVLRQPHILPVRVVSGDEEYNQASMNIDDCFFIVIPEDLMLMESLDVKKLDAILSAPKELIQSRLVGKKEITRTAFGDEYKQRKMSFTVSRDYFDALRTRESIGVQFSPRSITLNLARRVRTQVVLSQDNVEFKGLDELRAKGRDIEEVIFVPNTITIEGPAPVIERIAQDNRLLQLESLRLDDKDKDLKLGLSQGMIDQKLSIKAAVQEVGLKVLLKEETGERVLESMRIQVYFGERPLTLDERARIELESKGVNVRFIGPQSQIDILRGDNILRRKVQLQVNLDDVNADLGEALSLDDIISNKLGIPFDIKVFLESGFLSRPSIRIEPEQRTIRIVKKASSE